MQSLLAYLSEAGFGGDGPHSDPAYNWQQEMAAQGEWAKMPFAIQMQRTTGCPRHGQVSGVYLRVDAG
jgi:hypothetical protein